VYFHLKIGTLDLGRRIFGRKAVWSSDDRFLAVQEWHTTDESLGPRTSLLILDLERLREATFDAFQGFANPVLFEGHRLRHVDEDWSSGSCVAIEKETDVDKIDWWKEITPSEIRRPEEEKEEKQDPESPFNVCLLGTALFLLILGGGAASSAMQFFRATIPGPSTRLAGVILMLIGVFLMREYSKPVMSRLRARALLVAVFLVLLCGVSAMPFLKDHFNFQTGRAATIGYLVLVFAMGFYLHKKLAATERPTTDSTAPSEATPPEDKSEPPRKK